MATFDTTSYGSHGLVGRIGSIYETAIATVVNWNDARVTRNALQGLSDRELDDIGLIRGDIDLVADGHNRF